VTTVRTVFGSWNSGVAAAGLRPRRPGEARGIPASASAGGAESAVRWPKRRVLARLRAWAQEHGRPPTLEEWRRAGESHPSAATVRRLFGTWNAALVAAGFEARRPGVPLLPRTLTHRRCESSGRWVGRVA
jgi:hypothetical protein